MDCVRLDQVPERSAVGGNCAVTDSDDELFVKSKSVSTPVTEAELTIVPLFFGVMLIVTVAVVFSRSPATSAVTIPPAWLTEPIVEVALLKVTPAGSVSVITTPVAL